MTSRTKSAIEAEIKRVEAALSTMRTLLQKLEEEKEDLRRELYRVSSPSFRRVEPYDFKTKHFYCEIPPPPYGRPQEPHCLGFLSDVDEEASGDVQIRKYNFGLGGIGTSRKDVRGLRSNPSSEYTFYELEGTPEPSITAAQIDPQFVEYIRLHPLSAADISSSISSSDFGLGLGHGAGAASGGSFGLGVGPGGILLPSSFTFGGSSLATRLEPSDTGRMLEPSSFSSGFSTDLGGFSPALSSGLATGGLGGGLEAASSYGFGYAGGAIHGAELLP